MIGEKGLQMMNSNALKALLPLLPFFCMTAAAKDDADSKGHGLVGLRPPAPG